MGVVLYNPNVVLDQAFSLLFNLTLAKLNNVFFRIILIPEQLQYLT